MINLLPYLAVLPMLGFFLCLMYFSEDFRFVVYSVIVITFVLISFIWGIARLIK